RARMFARVSAAARGAVLEVAFDPELPGIFGPALQVTVRGSLGSVVFVTVPYVYSGPTLYLSYAWSHLAASLLARSAGGIFFPAGLPSGTRLIWGRAFPAPGASTWDFAVPVEGGFTSLVMIEGDGCPSEKV